MSRNGLDRGTVARVAYTVCTGLSFFGAGRYWELGKAGHPPAGGVFWLALFSGILCITLLGVHNFRAGLAEGVGMGVDSRSFAENISDTSENTESDR